VARTLGLWGPVLAWMAGLFAASTQSDIGPAGRIPDWLTHGSAYLVLCLLFCRALHGSRRRAPPGLVPLLAVALTTAYGVSDELHQSFVPGRDASAGDVAKDLGGATLAALAWRWAAARGPGASADKRRGREISP